MADEAKGGAPKVCWPEDNPALGIKILSHYIEDEIRHSKHKEVVEREGLDKGLPGKEVHQSTGEPGGDLSGEGNDSNPSPAGEEHSVE